jgi:hypothetical protein
VGVPGDFVARLNNFTGQIQENVLDVFGLSPLTKFQSRAGSQK